MINVQLSARGFGELPNQPLEDIEHGPVRAAVIPVTLATSCAGIARWRARRRQGKSISGPTLARGGTADPAGLTARGRPLARP